MAIGMYDRERLRSRGDHPPVAISARPSIYEKRHVNWTMCTNIMA